MAGRSAGAILSPAGFAAGADVVVAHHPHVVRGLERRGEGVILHGVGNPVAAMPSLHAGITFLIAIYGIQRLRTPWRWLLALYPLLMSTALVYYAEHYVVDVLAGALLAVVVLVGCQLWENGRDRAPRVSARSTEPTG